MSNHRIISSFLLLSLYFIKNCNHLLQLFEIKPKSREHFKLEKYSFEKTGCLHLSMKNTTTQFKFNQKHVLGQGTLKAWEGYGTICAVVNQVWA